MKKLLLGVVIGALGLFAFQRAQQHAPAASARETVKESEPEIRFVEVPDDGSRFHCDGRTHCSQMTSCEEATFFLRNCPGVQMDGEGDGVPCEKQWCGHQ